MQDISILILHRSKDMERKRRAKIKERHGQWVSLTSIPETLAGILLSNHEKYSELVVECGRNFYQIVKFVKTAIHYHRYLLKKHGYDNEFNFQSLKFSTVVLFMVKFIQQIYLF